MKLVTRLEKSFSFWTLLLTSFFFFILRWPSLFEPYWYGDEGVYQAVGLLMRKGYPLYSGAWENKPPILLLIYYFLNSDQLLIRAASLLFGLFSVVFFYLITKHIFPKSNKIVVLTTTIFTLGFGTPVMEGNIANAENFMLLPILIGAYLIIRADFEKIWRNKAFFLAGFILSLAFLTKIVAVFDFLAFGTFLVISSPEKLKNVFNKKIAPLIFGFIIPVVLTIAYFLVSNNFKDFLDAFILGNIGYVGYANQFFVPQGLLYIKAIALCVFVIFLYLKRRSIHKDVLFIHLWFAFSLFDVFFSQRPYTHYLLMLLPSFCLMVGLVLYERKTRLFTLIFLTAGFLLVNHSFSFQGKIISYYENLAAFCSDKKSLASYQSFFDANTPRDYQLSSYIKMNTTKNDSIFIWGNNAVVYKLTNKTPIMRYTVAYHITNFPKGIPEMENAIKTKKPKLIIIMPNVPKFPLPLNGYNEVINIKEARIYGRVL